MSPRRVTLTALLAAPLLLGSLTAAPAQAATGRPPVTAPDGGTTFPGNVVVLDPLANDTDPDGDELALCRLGTEEYKHVSAVYDGSDYVVVAGPRAAPGTYTFTYYACDFSYLSPGTVTLTVEAPPKVRMTAVPSRPGHVRVTNPADFGVRVFYGSFREDEPDGSVRVRAGASKVLRVRRERIDFIVFDLGLVRYVRTGHVRGIDLPRGTRSPVPGVRAPRWGG